MLWEPVLREDRVAYWALLFCAKQKRAAVVHSSSSSPPTFWVWNQFGNSWIYFFGNICFFGGGSLGSLYLQRKTSIFARFSCENLQFQVFFTLITNPLFSVPGLTQPPKTGVMQPLRLCNVLGHLASKFSGQLVTGLSFRVQHVKHAPSFGDSVHHISYTRPS